MKRAISLFFSVIIVFSLFAAFSLTAAADGETMLIGSDVMVNAGEEAQVSVKIKNNPGIFAAVIKISYDSENFVYSDYTDGDFSELSLDVKDTGKGYIGIVALGNSKDIAGDGTLFTLKFKVNDNVLPGRYKFTLNCLKGDMCNYDEEEIIPAVFSPTVTVKCTEHVFSIEKTDSAGSTYHVCENCGAIKTGSGSILPNVFKNAESDRVNNDGTVTKDGVSESETAGLGTEINSLETDNDIADINTDEKGVKSNNSNVVLIIIIISAVVLLTAAGIIIFKTVKTKGTE